MDRNTSNVSFYCRESKKDRQGLAPIELSIIINGERCFIHLPRKEYPSVFKEAVTSKKRNDIKDYLDLTRTRLNEIETELLRDGFAITSYAIKEHFQNGGIRKYTISDLFDEYRVRGKTLCLGIDVLKTEEEVLDIGYASKLSTEVLGFGV